jgi:acyl-coenzyme A synthetase/AMP-(fatty) acid ligase
VRLPHADDALVAVGAPASCTRGDLSVHVGGLVDALGPARGGERLVTCQDRYHFAVAVLACWSRGEIVRLPASLATDAVAEVARDVASVVDDAVVAAASPGAPDPLVLPDGDRVVVRLSTSGSTGAHQLHDKTATQVLGEAAMLGAHFEVPPGRPVLATIPPHHIYGLLFSVLMPLLRGAVVVRETPFFPDAIAARLRRDAPSTLVTVPAHLRVLAAEDDPAFGTPDLVFSSGAPLGARTAARIHEAFGLEVTEVFGSTETGGIAWRRQVRGAVWAPLPGVRVAAGVDGVLEVDSSFLPPDAARPWVADDRIRMEPDGFVHLGRRDDVVKVASKRVSLGAVTRALLDLDGVSDAAVVAVEARGRTLLRAAVVTTLADEAIRAALRERLDAVAVPRLHRVASLPRTANGKLPRAQLLALLDGRALTVRDRVTEGGAHAATVDVPEGCRWFDGHFPGDPILPGVAQLHELVVAEAAVAWPELGPCTGLGRVRFRKPVRPGATLRVTLERRAGQIRFAVLQDSATCTAGVATFEEAQ